MIVKSLIVPILLVLNILFLNFVSADTRTLKLLSTTSTRDSGLLEFLLPHFKKKYNIKVHVIAFGTGHVLELAKNCDGDLLLTHATSLENNFINNGYGSMRDNLMYNDFIILGPPQDPAKINSLKSSSLALKNIASTKSTFISRGDNSGTHISELIIWKAAEIDPTHYSGKWYLETGQGMGSSLNVAIAHNAYVYADRATWIRFANKGQHMVMIEKDPLMFNQYGLVKINPSHCPDIKHQDANLLYNWLISSPAQKLISEYRINNIPLFYPNFNK